ncbi:MAG TPA: hydroxylamine reductase [Prochlorococcus sp.]|tara:strand:- start:799 stop:2460 length:1662 start_codon:yes stop_codon:yes gene_type:complete
MFCFQCQEAAGGEGCTVVGSCGKTARTAALQDALMHVARGVAIYADPIQHQPSAFDSIQSAVHAWLRLALFTTITNANFEDEAIEARIRSGLDLRVDLQKRCKDEQLNVPLAASHAATWNPCGSLEIFPDIQAEIGVKPTWNSDESSLSELLTYGLKGLSAYLHHAAELGWTDSSLNAFLVRALVATINPHDDVSTLTALVMEAGENGVKAMALLDSANTGRYGHPEQTQVSIGVGLRPGILVSGHDLADLEALLVQSEDAGIDIYTHCEMLPAHSYPGFKKYRHLYGNYGNAWWQQHKEFTSFRGPILFTTNCIVPPPKHASYADKVFTTGATGFPGYRYIDRGPDGEKDFSELIAMAQCSEPPVPLESGTITCGFAHNQVAELATPILEAIESGAVKRFVVMAGCDGRHAQRDYYRNFAEKLSNDTVILTAGCAKYRYNKLDLGFIETPGGNTIPRILDAGQCNDSYSLALTALTLKDALGLDDINSLPIEYNIAWYEQKAVIVLLALLYLGVKDIQLGPTLPAFLSSGVTSLLVEQFGIHGIPTPEKVVA